MRRLGLGAAVALVVLFSVGPFAWIVLTSLKSPQEIAARPPTLVPEGSLAFYASALRGHGFLRALANSAAVAGATTVSACLLGAAAAYPLARMRLPFRRGVLSLVLAASLFPQIAVVGGIYRILSALGLLDTRPGLVLPYTALTLPFAIWVLASFFRELPPDLEEAARVDGCGPLAALWRVFLPVAAPGVFTTAILVFIYAWDEFFLALLVLTEPAKQTVPVAIARFPGQYLVPWGELAAAAVIATLPLVLLVLLLQRRIVRGLTAGAVKG